MEGPGTKLVDNETSSQSTRWTKEGKRLTYKLTVLQQPHRARACGSGAKSSADRRPVDPPPIVELKIYEGEDGDLRDVTFTVTANYFLFSTLEQARNIATGRGAPPQNQLTVLTGTPVAGMVYLDRPAPAGYFIFPDLSVRHEGKYRLSFSLYEELKDAKDEDKDSDPSKPNGAGDAHVTHRLEVKSMPFTVFSAKKFPGLSESTALSRMVAEQGCRVRIRRDVRLRRRGSKGKDWENYEEEMAETRARMSATPDGAAYPAQQHAYGDPISRPRSASNTSHHSMAQPVVSRRPSMQEMQQGYYPSHGNAPHTPQASYGHPTPYSGQQYQQNPMYIQQQQQPSMAPPPPQFSQPTYQPQSSQQGYYGYAPAPHQHAQPQWGPPPPSYESSSHSSRMSADYSSQMPSEHRRSSASQPLQHLHIPAPPAPSTTAQFANQQPQSYPGPPSNSYQHSHEPSIGSLDGYNSRLTPAEPPIRQASLATPLSARPSFDNNKLPSINTHLNNISNKYLEPASPATVQTPTGYQSSTQALNDTNKRGFGQVFNDSHLNQPLRQGARPSEPAFAQRTSTAGFVQPTDVDDDDGEPDYDARRRMIYRRANGRQIARHLPSHE